MTRNDWRQDLRSQEADGVALEAAAFTLRLPDEFQIRPSWPGIDWVEHGGTLDRFREMVKRTATLLGRPPDSCQEAHWLSSAESVPDLIAKWMLPGFDHRFEWRRPFIAVRVIGPSGCKVDPRQPGHQAVPSKLHPECAQVLDALTDFDPARP